MHISQEIIRGFANSDKEIEKTLFLEARKQAERAYKTNFGQKSQQYFH